MAFILKKIIQRGDIHNTIFQGLRNAQRILEIGCSRGGNCIKIHELHPDVEIHGVDIIDGKHVPEFIHYKRINPENHTLPFPDDYFDAVLIIYVLEHIQDPFKLCYEIRRVMKIGAVLFAEVPNWTTMFVPSFGFKRDQYNPFNFFDDPSHVRIWTKQSLFEFIHGGCGLKTDKIRTSRNPLKIPLDILSILKGLFTGNRDLIVLPFWNIFGWCIHGVGYKLKERVQSISQYNRQD
jgi:SAM-dependent methyltransferase